MDAVNSDSQNADGSSALDPGKIFVGGLSWQTTTETLRDYFSTYGCVEDCTVMKDPVTKRSRGFGFVNYSDPSSVDKVLASGPHVIDSKRVDPKKSIPKPKLIDSNSAHSKAVSRTRKMFVGGLSASTTADDVRNYFEQFGPVEDAILMYDKMTMRHRGFAFVMFQNEDTVDIVVDMHYHEINNKLVECKKAQPKEVLPTPHKPAKNTLPALLPLAFARSDLQIPNQTCFAYAGSPYAYMATGNTGAADRLMTATPTGATYLTVAGDYGSLGHVSPGLHDVIALQQAMDTSRRGSLLPTANDFLFNGFAVSNPAFTGPGSPLFNGHLFGTVPTLYSTGSPLLSQTAAAVNYPGLV